MCWVLRRHNSSSFTQPRAVVTVISHALQMRELKLGVVTTRTGRAGNSLCYSDSPSVACTTTLGFSQYGMVFIWVFTLFWHHLKVEFSCSYTNDGVILGYTLYFKNLQFCWSRSFGQGVQLQPIPPGEVPLLITSLQPEVPAPRLTRMSFVWPHRPSLTSPQGFAGNTNYLQFQSESFLFVNILFV